MKSNKARIFFSILLLIAITMQIVPMGVFGQTLLWSLESVQELNAVYGDVFRADDTPITISEAKGMMQKLFHLDINESINGIPQSEIFPADENSFFTRKDLAVLVYAILKLSPLNESTFADCDGLTPIQKYSIDALQSHRIISGSPGNPDIAPEQDPDKIYFNPHGIVNNGTFSVLMHRVMLFGYEYAGSINIPEQTGSTSVTVWGITIPECGVAVYDNGELSAQTTSNSIGRWQTQIRLQNPGEKSTHTIFAKITSKTSNVVETEHKTLQYSMELPKLSRITMRYDNQHLEFDFQNPASVAPNYTYNVHQLLPFTFTVEFTDDTDIYSLGEVFIATRNSTGGFTYIPTGFDPERKLWVGTYTFDEEALTAPTAVGAAYQSTSVAMDTLPMITQSPQKIRGFYDQLDSVFTQLDEVNEEIAQIEASNALIEENTEDFVNEADFFEVTDRLDALATELEKQMAETTGTALSEMSADTDFDAAAWYASILGKTDEEIQAEILNDYENAFALYDAIDASLGLDEVYDQIGFTVTDENDVKKVSGNGIETTLIEGDTRQYTESRVADEGFTVYEKPNGQKLYIKTDDTQIILLDFEQNKSKTILFSTVVKTESFNGRFFSSRPMYFSAPPEDTRSDFGKGVSTVNDVVSKVNTFIGAVENITDLTLEGNLAAAKNKMIEACEKNRTVKLKHKSGGIGILDLNLSEIHKETARNALVRASKTLSKWKVLKLKYLKGPGISVLGMVGDLLDFLDKSVQVFEVQKLAEQYNESACPGAKEVISRQMQRLDDMHSANTANLATMLSLSAVSTVDVEPATAIGLFAAILARGIIYDKLFEHELNDIKSTMSQAMKDCKSSKGPTLLGTQNAGLNVDPSGYVFEAVASNRVEGAKVTVYYKNPDSEESVLWDASRYDQKNPLMTNDKGRYAWDVPPGLWQVKAEKDGYETGYSDWLTVPPPQLDVNIGLVSNAAPVVASVNGYPDAIIIVFSKYMDIASLTLDKFKLEGFEQEFDIAFADSENNPVDISKTYATTVLLTPKSGKFELSKTYTLTMDGDIKSYAETALGKTFSTDVTIQSDPMRLELPDAISLKYGEASTLKVMVSPADSGKNVSITAESAYPDIVSVTPEAVTDSSGVAFFTITGNLPGEAPITFTVNGARLKDVIDVRVDLPVKKSLSQVDRFTDIKESDWFYKEVDFVVSTGLFNGVTTTTFSPKTPITRGMFVAVLGRLYEKSLKSGASITASQETLNTFSDVSPNVYYAKYIAWACENKIVKGNGGGRFAPDKIITRQEIATMLLRYASYIGKSPQGAWAIHLDFTDTNAIEDWATEGVMYCYMKGIITGKPGNLLDPSGQTTRAEVAVMLHRFI